MTESEHENLESAGLRAQALSHVREARARYKKKEKRRTLIVQLSVSAGILVMAGVIFGSILTVGKGIPSAPQSMSADGITIASVQPNQLPAEFFAESDGLTNSASADDVVNIRLYVDYLCASCGAFSRNNSEQLHSWVDAGAVTLEVHPLALLTAKSSGTQYSLRAANAAACVAEYAPEYFLDFHDALLQDQPEVDSEGLSDDEILLRAAKVGVKSQQVTTCLQTHQFFSWVQEATARALNGPISNADIEAITAAPTILVNGKQFSYTKDFDPNELASFVTDAAGELYQIDPAGTEN